MQDNLIQEQEYIRGMDDASLARELSKPQPGINAMLGSAEMGRRERVRAAQTMPESGTTVLQDQIARMGQAHAGPQSSVPQQTPFQAPQPTPPQQQPMPQAAQPAPQYGPGPGQAYAQGGLVRGYADGGMIRPQRTDWSFAQSSEPSQTQLTEEEYLRLLAEQNGQPIEPMQPYDSPSQQVMLPTDAQYQSVDKPSNVALPNAKEIAPVEEGNNDEDLAPIKEIFSRERQRQATLGALGQYKPKSRDGEEDINTLISLEDVPNYREEVVDKMDRGKLDRAVVFASMAKGFADNPNFIGGLADGTAAAAGFQSDSSARQRTENLQQANADAQSKQRGHEFGSSQKSERLRHLDNRDIQRGQLANEVDRTNISGYKATEDQKRAIEQLDNRKYEFADTMGLQREQFAHTKDYQWAVFGLNEAKEQNRVGEFTRELDFRIKVADQNYGVALDDIALRDRGLTEADRRFYHGLSQDDQHFFASLNFDKERFDNSKDEFEKTFGEQKKNNKHNRRIASKTLGLRGMQIGQEIRMNNELISRQGRVDADAKASAASSSLYQGQKDRLDQANKDRAFEWNRFVYGNDMEATNAKKDFDMRVETDKLDIDRMDAQSRANKITEDARQFDAEMREAQRVGGSTNTKLGVEMLRQGGIKLTQATELSKAIALRAAGAIEAQYTPRQLKNLREANPNSYNDLFVNTYKTYEEIMTPNENVPSPPGTSFNQGLGGAAPDFRINADGTIN